MNRDRRIKYLYLLLALLVMAVLAAPRPGRMAPLAQSVKTSRMGFFETLEDEARGESPALVLATALTGVVRGPMIISLWWRAAEKQQNEEYYELAELYDKITKFQKRFPKVWQYAAWNAAYNLSVKEHSFDRRWIRVKEGISLLRNQGIVYCPRAADLYYELAWIYSHKIGKYSDDADMYYKDSLALDMTRAFGEGRQEDLAPFMAVRGLTLRQLIGDNDTLRKLVDDLEQAGFRSGDTKAALDFLLDSEAAQQLLADPRHQRVADRLLRWARVRYIEDAQHLHLSFDYIRQIYDEFGVVDFRLPDTHALYWAVRATEYAREGQFDDNFYRVAKESLYQLIRTGRLFFRVAPFTTPEGRTIQQIVRRTYSDTRYVDKLHDYYLRIEKATVDPTKPYQVNSFLNDFRRFFDESLVALYLEGDMGKFGAYLEKARKRYPNEEKFRQQSDEWFRKEIRENTLEVNAQRANVFIDNLIRRAFYGFALGQTEHAQQLWTAARQGYNAFLDQYGHHQERLGLWNQKRDVQVVRFLIQHTGILRERFLEWLLAHQMTRAELKTLFEQAGIQPGDFPDIFPPETPRPGG